MASLGSDISMSLQRPHDFRLRDICHSFPGPRTFPTRGQMPLALTFPHLLQRLSSPSEKRIKSTKREPAAVYSVFWIARMFQKNHSRGIDLPVELLLFYAKFHSCIYVTNFLHCFEYLHIIIDVTLILAFKTNPTTNEWRYLY